jgi:hypothetical protein
MQHDEFEREMNCTAFKNRLAAILDERQSPAFDIQLAAHARRCQPCAQWLETQSEILELASAERRQNRSRQRKWTSILAAAACLMIGFLAWPSLEPSERLGQTEAVADPAKIPDQLRRRVDAVAEDVKPVTSHVYTAFNAFWLAQRML